MHSSPPPASLSILYYPLYDHRCLQSFPGLHSLLPLSYSTPSQERVHFLMLGFDIISQKGYGKFVGSRSMLRSRAETCIKVSTAVSAECVLSAISSRKLYPRLICTSRTIDSRNLLARDFVSPVQVMCGLGKRLRVNKAFSPRRRVLPFSPPRWRASWFRPCNLGSPLLLVLTSTTHWMV